MATGVPESKLVIRRLWPLSEPEYRWARLLVTACETLSRAPAGLVNTVTVTNVLSGGHGEARAVEALGEELAAQYGLEAVVERGDRSLTIRFSRPRAEGTGER